MKSHRKALYEAKYPETKAGQAQAASTNKKLGRRLKLGDVDVGEIISPTFTECGGDAASLVALHHNPLFGSL
jgi:hypothetical protein